MRTQSFKYLVGFVLALWASALSAQTHWSCNVNAYQYDMTVYFELQKNGVAVAAEDLGNFEVAAFVGNECRGVGEFLTATVSEQTIHYGYLRVRSNVASGETVSFKAYVKDAELEVAIDEEANITFANAQAEGYPSAKKALNISMFQLTFAETVKGTYTGEGSYYRGAQASVKATPGAGYVFTKWSDESTDNPHTVIVNEPLNLSAVFTPIPYTITYDLGGGSLNVANPTAYNVESSDITLNKPVREAYTFDGWSGTDIVDGEKNVVITTGSTGNRSYTALWVATGYAINYDLAGGTVETPNPETYTIKSEPITLNNPTREGYTFAGWTGTGLSEATQEVTILTGSTGTRSYTATWTPVTYYITFDLDDGTLPDGVDNPKAYTVESAGFYLPTPTKEGKTFKGWTGEDLLQATKPVFIAQGTMNDRTYTAEWTEKEDVLLGDVNGDGLIDTVDMSLLINKILGIEDDRFVEAAGDLNNDGNYDTVDLSLLINLILNQ